MAGIRIGGVAVLPPARPPFPYVAFEGASQNAIWLMGDLVTPERLSTTQGIKLTNPMLNPTNPDEAVYCDITFAGDAIIYTLDLENNTKNAVITLSGQIADPMPYWHPNGTTIVYRKVTGSPGAGNEVWTIQSIESDGSNDQTLYTFNTGSTFLQALSCPCYSPSGDFIAFGKGIAGAADEVWVMEDDGSNPGSVASVGGDTSGLQWTTPYCWMAWQNSADVLGWAELQAGTGDVVAYRSVNADGTNLQTLASVNNVASPAPQVHANGVGRFPWLLDDSGMVTLVVDDTTDPRWRLALVDAGGGGISFLDSHFSYASFTGNPYGQPSWNFTPQVFRIENAAADGRIYFSLGDSLGVLIDQDVVSTEPDGTDLRTDDDGTESPSHGWWTITGYGD
jgi:hypothetical protein